MWACGRAALENLTPSTPHAAEEGDDGWMNCAAVDWARRQDVRSASAGRLLIEIAAEQKDGRCSLSQVELGRRCKLAERQTRTILRQLEEDGFVARARHGGEGKGRAPDSYVLVGFRQPAMIAESHDTTGNETQVEATGNRQIMPVAWGGNRQPEAPYEGATGNLDRQSLPIAATGNSAPTPPNIITTTSTSQDNPPPTELGGDGVFALTSSDAPKRAGSNRGSRMVPGWRPSQASIDYATDRGIINGWCEATLENFVDYWLGVPGQRGIKSDWEATWRNEVRKEQRDQRHKPKQGGGFSAHSRRAPTNGISKMVY